MKIIPFLICLLASHLLQSQVIQLQEIYSGEGVIFDKEVQYPFGELDYRKSLTPTIQNVKEAEQLLAQKYYKYRTNVLDSFGVSKSIIKEKLRNPKNVRKKFDRYNRQYLGYITQSNDTIITVGLLNFSNKRKADKYFPNWNEQIHFGFHGFYEDNQEWYSINITKDDFVYKIGK